MRIFLGLIFFGISILIGHFYSSRLSKKRIFYNSFLEFNKLIKNEISYSQNTIKYFVDKNVKNDDFNIFVKKHFNDMGSECEIKYLTDDEKTFLLNYLNKLGMADSISQIEYINQTNDIVQKNLNDAIYNETKYRSLYLKLGFLVGLIAFLLCI